MPTTIKKWNIVYMNGSRAVVNGSDYQAAALRAMQISKSPIRDIVLATAIKPPKSNPRPRIGTAKSKRRSTATGKAPTKRLISRRVKNSRKGYFPNPKTKKRRAVTKRREYAQSLFVEIKRSNKWFEVQNYRQDEQPRAEKFARMLGALTKRPVRLIKK